MKGIAIFCVFLLFGYAVMAFFVIPPYEEMYKSFGDDLPGFTQLVLTTYQYWLILPVIPLLLYGLTISEMGQAGIMGKIVKSSIVSTLTFTICFIPLLFVAAYLPIFKLGASI